MAALFDFLKKKEEAEKSRKAAEKTQKTEKKADAVKSPAVSEKKAETEKAKKEPAAKPQAGKKAGNFVYETVKKPHISEKASYLSEKDQYVFEVLSDSNKKEIKNSVEGIYGVNVLSVNVITIPAKKRRLGRSQGFKKGYKKAIVRIKDGQKIEIL